MIFAASWFAYLLRPASLLALLHGSDRITPAIEGFYIQAFGKSVAFPAAGHNYNSDWTPLLAGLTPARMTTSLAAPTPISLSSRRVDRSNFRFGHAQNHHDRSTLSRLAHADLSRQLNIHSGTLFEADFNRVYGGCPSR
jgi:hypothetical protein